MRHVVSDRRLLLVFWLFVASGITFTLLNLDLPVARNALTYARASLGIVEHGFDLFAVVGDSSWTSGKPLLFAAIAAPLTWLSNANAGTVLASCLGTVFFLWTVAIAIIRLNQTAGLDQRLAPLAFTFVAANPLVIYQFWSAYPDSLFAGLVLLAFVLSDIVAREPWRDTRGHILCLGLVVVLAIHTKLYGAILGIACPAYLFLLRKSWFEQSIYRTSKIGFFVTAWVLMLVMLILAKLRIYPLLEFAPGAGFDGYIAGVVGEKVRQTVASARLISATLLLIFNVSLFFLAARAAWTAWTSATTAFVAIYVIGLLPYYGSTDNMRFFLPVLPFLAVALVAGAASMSKSARWSVVGGFAVASTLLVLIFNAAPVLRIFDPLLARVVENSQHRFEGSWLDNLRLPVQLELRRQILEVNEKVPAGSILYWSSDYYNTGTHGLAEHLGIKRGLDIRYVSFSSQVEPHEEPVFVFRFGASQLREELYDAPDWAVIEHVGSGLFRLDPFFVQCAAASESARSTESTPLHARATVGDRFGVATVEFVDGDTSIGVTKHPFELTLPLARSSSRHVISARARDARGMELVSAPVVCFSGVDAFERSAQSRADLAWEVSNGSTFYGTDGLLKHVRRVLELSDRMEMVGMRFTDLDIPAGAEIASAYIELTAAEPASVPTVVDIRAEQIGNAAALEPKHRNLTRRRGTQASVEWRPVPWTAVGQHDRSPELAMVLQEIIDRAQWEPGSSIVLLLRTSGRRAAQLPGDRSVPPKLYVELKPQSKGHGSSTLSSTMK